MDTPLPNGTLELLNHTLSGDGGGDRYQGYDGLIVVERTLDNYVIPGLCALGMLGNLVSLLVLTRAWYSHSEAPGERAAQSGLVALGLADLLFCVVMFPRGFLGSTLSLFDYYDFWLVYQSLGSWVVTSLIMTSTWITVTLTTLRYLGICHPLRCRRLVGVVSERLAYLVVTLVCWGVNLPAFWQYHVYEMPMEGNRTAYLVDIGALDYSAPRGVAFLWVRGLLGVALPAVILVGCNTALVRALRRSSRMRRQYHVNGHGNRFRYRVTVTLGAISMGYILLVMPSELMDFLFLCIASNRRRTEAFLLARAVANTLQVANFAGNFLLYCSVNSRFRQTFRSLFRCGNRSSRSARASARIDHRQSYIKVITSAQASRSAGSGHTRSSVMTSVMTSRHSSLQYSVPNTSMIGSMNLTEYTVVRPTHVRDTNYADATLEYEINSALVTAL